MSTILKALRKLEREKALPAQRQTLREAVATGVAEPIASPRRAPLLLPAAALLSGIAVGAGALWLWPEPSARSNATLAEVKPLAPPSAPSPRASSRIDGASRKGITAIATVREDAPQGELDGLPDAAFSSPVEVVNRPARQPRIPAPGPSPAAPERATQPTRELVIAQAPEADPWFPAPEASEAPATSLPEPELRPAPERPARFEQPAAPPPVARTAPELPPPAAPPAATTAMPAAAAPEPEPAATAVAPPAAAAADLAEADPAETPQIHVARTWWHPAADRREALLRLDGDAERRVREGERVGAALVMRIEPSGVVFSHGDSEFRRRIGEASD